MWFRILAISLFLFVVYLFVHFKLAKAKEQNRLLASILSKSDQDDDVDKFKEKKSQRYLQKLIRHMETEKPYRDPELSLNAMANYLNVTGHYLSGLINRYLNCNFNIFLNNYRIAEIKEKLKDPSYDNENILNIAFESGFSTKAHFNNTFKKYTGITPSEYRKKQKDLR